MKLKVTQKGVYDQKGNRVSVGAELSIKGDKVPSYLIGKASVMDEAQSNGKQAVTNPKSEAVDK